MFKLLSVGVLSVLLAGPLMAHFIFIVPQPGAKDAQVVFSDDLEPDEAVAIAKISGLELFARDAADKESAIKSTTDKHSLTAPLPAGTRQVFGSITYGVMQKGANAPYQLRYHPKTILGDAFTPRVTVGDKLPLEVVPVGKAGAVRFQVLAKGKALAAAEVNVLVPGNKKQKVTTDAEGMTAPFEATGRYGLWTRYVDPTPGELQGKKFDETKHYATLVVDIGAK